MIKSLHFLSTICIAFFILPSSAFAKSETLRRFAFVVGANDGGNGRAMLRFANQDAESFVVVLNELGGVASGDTVLVRDATKKTINQGLEKLKAQLLHSVSKGERQEVVFYYSGHADDEGLRLKQEVLPYKELKDMITALPVDVQILVIDSCASGQLAMSKGGLRKPAFLMDASSKTRGHAIITSSSSDEAAQESANIRGSIFTHYFISGLRGAADSNTDRKVTLSEAYQYAYAETLARTEKTMSGAQHPAYDFKLAGTGDLTLTDLRQSSAILTLPSQSSGRYFIRNKDGELAAELNKPAGRPVELGLEPGTYSIGLDKEKKYFEGSFALKANGRIDVSQITLTQTEGEVNQTRGKKEYRIVPATIGLLPPLENWNTVTSDELHYFSFDLLGGHSGKLQGGALTMFGHVVDDGVDGAMVGIGVNWDRGDLRGVQVTAAGNYVGGDMIGAQMAAGVNMVAGRADGAQFGVVNIANEFNGAQFGVVNIARSYTGAQFGVVNISENAEGAPIGVVSYVKNGRKDLDLWLDELAFTHLAFKMGSKYVYTLYDLGLRGGGIRYTTGIGLGAIYEPKPFFASIESITINEQPRSKKKPEDQGLDEADDDDSSSNNTFEVRTQVSFGLNVYEGMSIYLGPAYCISNRGEEDFNKDVSPRFSSLRRVHETWASWVGANAGIKYEF